MTTGEKIRLLRKARNMTQDSLGKAIGVQKAAINKYETGQIINLKRATIQRLSAALGCSPLFLFDDSESLTNEDHWNQYVQDVALFDASTLTDEEKKLISSFRRLSDEGRSYISGQIDIASRVYADSAFGKDELR